MFRCLAQFLPRKDDDLKDDDLRFKRSTSFRIESFVGNGQSSRSSRMTAGPSGSFIGITLIIELTTVSHPFSLSAMTWSRSIAWGGSCSLSTRVLNTDNVSNTKRSTWWCSLIVFVDLDPNHDEILKNPVLLLRLGSREPLFPVEVVPPRRSECEQDPPVDVDACCPAREDWFDLMMGPWSRSSRHKQMPIFVDVSRCFFPQEREEEERGREGEEERKREGVELSTQQQHDVVASCHWYNTHQLTTVFVTSTLFTHYH